MKRIALPLALVLLLAACGDDDTSAETTVTTAAPTSTSATTTTAGDTTTTAAPTTTVAETTTTEADGPTGVVFQIASVSFGAPMVTIYNIGDEGGSLAGHWLCQRPSYIELPDITLEPGEGVAISLGGNVFLPPPGLLTADGQFNVGGVDGTSGELALYSSNDFGSSDAIVSYVEWGTADHGRSSVAVGAGIWEAGAFVVTTGDSAVIQITDFGDTGPSGWTAF